MASQLAFRTPKLKRDNYTTNTTSTLDHTALVLRSRPAAFLTDLRPPPRLNLAHPPIPVPARLSVPSETAELQRELGRLMGKDEQLSQRSRLHTKGGHSYTLRPLQSHIVLAESNPIPQRVRQLYEQYAATNEGQCEFKQGVLPTACLYYFAVGCRVLFYDVGRAVQTGGRLEESFMHECKFEDSVLEVRQMALRHAIFGEFKNRSILLVVTPWKFSFAALELQGGDRLQAGPRWMRLTLLTTILPTASQIASHIVEDKIEQRLYYLDEEGGVNCVSFEDNNWLGKLTGNTNRYRLAQLTAPSSINAKAFFVSRKATIWERLQHYSRVVLAQATSFYGKCTKNYDLVCDSRRRLVFSLVDTNYDIRDCTPSPYKLLTAWDTSNSKLAIKCQISEAELYERQIAGIANYPLASNYRIARLATVSPCLDADADLMLVLECGIRLHVSVEGTFRVLQHHFPPALDRPALRNCDPREHHRTVELTHCSLEGSSLVMNLKEEGDNHTFFIWRRNEESEAQQCAELVWGSSMNSPSGNPPLENQLQCLQLRLGASKKEQIIKELTPRATKSLFSGSAALPHLHQLARDLLLPPTPFLHSTDEEIEWFYEVRPIDRAFSALQAGVRDENVLARVFEGFPCEELLFLLVQLFCDPEGLYLKDQILTDCLAQYERRVLQQGGLPFDKFQDDFACRTKAKGPRREIQPVYVGRESMGAQMEDRVLELVVRVGRRGQGVRMRTEREVQQSVCTAILLYLARLLRLLWRRSVKKVNSKLQPLVAMIHPLYRIIEHLRSPASRPKDLPQRGVKFQHLFPGRKAEEESNDTTSSQLQPLDAMSKLISRISQLITMCSKVDLRIEKTFVQALAMSSEEFEGPLFRFLTEKYDHPAAAFDVFRHAFPCFVGEQLQKSLRIEQESRGKNENEIVAILRYHRSVPSYLLRFFEASGKIHAESVRSLQSLSTAVPPSKPSISCNVREGVTGLLRRLKEPEATLTERSLAIVQLNSLLAHYLRTHQQQDRFYRDSRAEIELVEGRLNMQQLLIEQYEARGQANLQIVSELKTSLFQMNVLQDLVGLLGPHRQAQ